jgi:glycopeptide antibiotics resistance protein
LYLMNFGRNLIRFVLLLVFFVYLAVLVKVILFKGASPTMVIESLLNSNMDDFKRKVILSSNFTPFKTIFGYLVHETNKNIAIRNIVGNLALFIPFGFLLPMLVGRKLNYWKIIMLSFLMSLVLELVQLFSIGSCDVDDLLLNTIGAALGYIIQSIISRTVIFTRDLTNQRLR